MTPLMRISAYPVRTTEYFCCCLLKWNAFYNSSVALFLLLMVFALHVSSLFSSFTPIFSIHVYVKIIPFYSITDKKSKRKKQS